MRNILFLPRRMKKHCYLLLVMFLRIMLSYIAHVIWLAKFGQWMLPSGPALLWCGDLPMRAQFSVVITGLVVGYFVGNSRRNIVYVEKRHRRNWFAPTPTKPVSRKSPVKKTP